MEDSGFERSGLQCEGSTIYIIYLYKPITIYCVILTLDVQQKNNGPK